MSTAIRTRHDYPPIPIRSMDWSATFDNYEPGCPIGFGPTEQAAITDLLMVAGFPCDHCGAENPDEMKLRCTSFQRESFNPFEPCHGEAP